MPAPVTQEMLTAVPIAKAHTAVVHYAMFIVTTRFDLSSSVLETIQQKVPSVIEAVSDFTRKKTDGCLIIDVPFPDIQTVEHMLDTMPNDVVYDYITITWDQS